MTAISTAQKNIFDTIPQDWKRSLVKYLANYTNGFAFKPDDWGDKGKPILRIQNFSNPDADFNRYDGELPKDYLVRKGDILISWSASLSVFRWFREDAWLNQHIFKAEVNETLVDPSYFIWLATWFVGELEHRAHGSTMQHLTKDAFGSFAVLLPPLQKQKKIADYLDLETRRIDALVKAKERLLVLLDEKRRALVTHAVTLGLNPTAPTRDSGIEWLGPIPTHWITGKLKTICDSLQTGPFGSQLHAEDYVEGGIPFINPVHLVNGRIIPDLRVTVDKEAANRLSIHKLQEGDLVFARRGEIGRCAIVTQDETGWICGSGSLRARPKKTVINTRYLLLLVSYTFAGQWLLNMSVGTTMSNLNTEIIGELTVPTPPIEEQLAIIDYLDQKISKLSALHVVTQKTIDLLQERRTALIAAAVTGQLHLPQA